MDGEFRAQVLIEAELPQHVNQRVAMLKATGIRPELLCAWLSRVEGQHQMNRWAVKTTVEHTSLVLQRYGRVATFCCHSYSTFRLCPEVTMTPEQIQELEPAFADYLQQFADCCGCPATFHLLQVYCRGLLSDLPRKTAEPLAWASGTAVRTLQEFLRDHVWYRSTARDTLIEHVAGLLDQFPDDDLGTVGIVDETGMVKKGTKTPGVQRQWCGEIGKKENCIVTVHLGVAKGRFKTLIDADLFLPESWDGDRDRCREADIPDHVVYRPKWQLAARQVRRARALGVDLDWLTFDENYGSKPGFLRELDRQHLAYVGEVPKSFACFTAPPRPGEPSHRADELVRHSPVFHQQAAQQCALARQTLGEQLWQAKSAPVWLRDDGEVLAGNHWLIWGRNEQSSEEKYFIAAGAEGASLGLRLRVGFQRWNVEHSLRTSKSEVGLRHFEGRSYVGLLRHLQLCLITLTFAAGQAAELRGEKSGGDDRAGLPGVELGQRGVAGSVAADHATAEHLGHHSLPPTAQSCGAGVPAAPQPRAACGVHATSGTLDAPPQKNSAAEHPFAVAL
jgi:SRSO17 transposase